MPADVSPDRSDQQRHFVGALISQAQVELSATLSHGDSLDAKALGLLALDIGGVALLLNAHPVLNRFWPALLVGAFVSASAFASSLWFHHCALGPDVDAVYASMIDSSPLESNVVILDSLTQAIDNNLALVARMQRGCVAGAGIVAFTAVAAAVYLPVVG